MNEREKSFKKSFKMFSCFRDIDYFYISIKTYTTCQISLNPLSISKLSTIS